MPANRVFRVIGALGCLLNGSALIGLSMAWLLASLYQSHLIPGMLAWLLMLLVPVAGLVAWRWWVYEYQSESPSTAERFYRNLPAGIGVGAYILGCIHLL